MVEVAQVQYAGFWRRALAMLIDALFFAILSYLLLYLFYGQAYFDWVKTNQESFAVYTPWDAVINNLLPLLITVVCWVKFRGTPGKLLLGCQVVDAQTLRPIGWGRALLRYVGYFVSVLPLGLGFFWVLWDKRKQGFHDKLAKTVVIHEDEAHASYKELEKGWTP